MSPKEDPKIFFEMSEIVGKGEEGIYFCSGANLSGVTKVTIVFDNIFKGNERLSNYAIAAINLEFAKPTNGVQTFPCYPGIIPTDQHYRSDFIVEPNDPIIRIAVWTIENILIAMQFTTKSGTVSELYGKPEGSGHKISTSESNYPDGQLAGMCGTYHESNILSVGFTFAVGVGVHNGETARSPPTKQECANCNASRSISLPNPYDPINFAQLERIMINSDLSLQVIRSDLAHTNAMLDAEAKGYEHLTAALVNAMSKMDSLLGDDGVEALKENEEESSYQRDLAQFERMKASAELEIEKAKWVLGLNESTNVVPSEMANGNAFLDGEAKAYEALLATVKGEMSEEDSSQGDNGVQAPKKKENENSSQQGDTGVQAPKKKENENDSQQGDNGVQAPKKKENENSSQQGDNGVQAPKKKENENSSQQGDTCVQAPKKKENENSSQQGDTCVQAPKKKENENASQGDTGVQAREPPSIYPVGPTVFRSDNDSMWDYNSIVGSDIDAKIRNHNRRALLQLMRGKQKKSASQIGSSVKEGVAPPTSDSSAVLPKENTSKTGPNVGEGVAPPTSDSSAVLPKENTSKTGPNVGEDVAPPTSDSSAALPKEDTSKTSPNVGVWGAGLTEVNGLYLRNDLFEGVVNYSKFGMFKGKECEFFLFKRNVSNNKQHWRISIVPLGNNPASSFDTDFYSVTANVKDEILPPTTSWKKCYEGVYPPPVLTYEGGDHLGDYTFV